MKLPPTLKVSLCTWLKLPTPLTNATDSHIYMSLISDIVDDKRYGDWKCCETREFVDAKLDANGDVQRFKDLYPTKRNKGRLVECHMGCSSDQRVSSIDVDKMLVDVMDKEFF
jgi:hypothetical protein